MLRRWDPTTSVYKYSSLGKQYYNTSQQEVTIHLPVTIYGKRANGTTYTFTGHMPIVSEGVTRTYRPNGNMQQLKQLVLADYQDNGMYEGARVVHQASEEIWTYRNTGNWKVSVLNTNPNAKPIFKP